MLSSFNRPGDVQEHERIEDGAGFASVLRKLSKLYGIVCSTVLARLSLSLLLLGCVGDVQNSLQARSW